MKLKVYKNEFIALMAFFIMLVAFSYKQSQISGQMSSAVKGSQVLYELKEVISLKKVWTDKRITKKVDVLKTLLSPSKVVWNKKSKSLTARFSSLSPHELNKIVTKVLNLPLQIEKLKIQKSDLSYSVELKCKW